jgi:hypothetical protein
VATYLRVLAGAVMAGAIAMRAQERRLVEALELAGAVTPETATKLPLTNLFPKMIFRRLLNVGAVGETMMQLQYLRVVEYAAWRARRRRRALLVLPVILALVAYAYLRSRNP